MKKKILSCLILLAVFSSCKKSFLDKHDPNQVAVVDFFKSEGDVLEALNGCYQSLRGNNNIGENSETYSDIRSDDMVLTATSSNNGEPFQFSDFSLTPANSYVQSHWTAMFGTIARCNVVLSNIDKVGFASETTREEYRAEAKFLRAFIYFNLVREFGPLPLVTTQIVSTDQASTFTFRADEKTVYGQIVADLTDVVGSPLPNLPSDYHIGRASKAAALALLGKVYLTMATTIDQANRQTNLTNAKTQLMAAYQLRKFGNLSEIPFTDPFTVSKKDVCPELLFQIVNIQGDANYSSSVAANYEVNGDATNTLKPATTVSYVVKHDLINEFEVNDPRYTFSIKFGTVAKDYFITKFRDASAAAGVNGYGGNDWVLMRYADVILCLAEVNLYLGDNATATQYLDMVRTRAGMPAYAVSMTNATYAANFPTLKLAILHERRSEFAFEHQRWFDLLRFFTPDELVTYFHAKSQANYGSSKLTDFTTKDRYYPIPFNETKLDPVKMYQNPGY
jgi:hypothetical protein